MTPNTKRTIVFSVLLLLAAGGGVGYYLYNKKPLNPNDLPPAITTNSSELYQAFSSDTVAAKKKFSRKDEVIEVSGTITGVSQNQDKQTIVLLKTNEQSASVNCTVEGDVKDLKQGDSIRLKGFCSGMGVGDTDLGIAADVYMIRCYLVK